MDGGQVGLATRMAADIRALAAIPRPPASAGELAAADWLRERLAGLGLSAEIESFRFNPDYGVIWGSHLLVAAVAASLPLFFGQQLAVAGAIVAAIVAISVWGELTARFRLLGSLFPKRVSWNVLARSGNRAASATLLIGAHHDAARSGSAFHPWLIARGRGSPPPLYILFIAILIVTVAASMSAIGAGGAITSGLLIAGGLVCLAYAALFFDNSRSPVSPGANDNASGVAVLLALAESIASAPPEGLDVWFVSTGSEEGFLGGIKALLERHQEELRQKQPLFIAIEMCGSGEVVYFEGEGFLRRYRYDEAALDLAARAARDPSSTGVRAVKTAPFASDALVATHRGIPAVTVASVNAAGFIPHYHWSTDTPDNVDIGSVVKAYDFIRAMIERYESTQRSQTDEALEAKR